jgi:hypothetical protein
MRTLCISFRQINSQFHSINVFVLWYLYGNLNWYTYKQQDSGVAVSSIIEQNILIFISMMGVYNKTRQ